MEQDKFRLVPPVQESRIQRTTSFLQFINDPAPFDIELHQGDTPTGKNDSVRLSRKKEGQENEDSVRLLVEDIVFMERQGFEEIGQFPYINSTFRLLLERFDYVRNAFEQELQAPQRNLP